jgi:hypothetical protein
MKSGLANSCGASGGHALPSNGKRRRIINSVLVFPGLSAPAAAQKTDPASLSRLHDIVMPEAVSWWPPGPAWVVAGYILFAVFLGLGIRAWRKWAANRYRRLALRELAEIERFRGTDAAIEAIPALLKRTALVAYGRPAVASLSGEAWYRFLEGSSRLFQEVGKPSAFFVSLAYQPAAGTRLTTEERAGIVRAARCWIRSHRVNRTEAKE